MDFLKALLSFFLLLYMSLGLALSAFADQQTTVLTRKIAFGASKLELPYIDGSTNELMEAEANKVIQEAAVVLAQKSGGDVTYRVTLNRPSLLGVLLIADNGGAKDYAGLNLDLTSGREFGVPDFFTDSEEMRNTLAGVSGVLFGEKGIYLRGEGAPSYDRLLPYNAILPSIRMGEAGRIMQIARLTSNAAGKVLDLGDKRLFAIKLDSNPSTGYSWHISCPSESVKTVGSSFTIPRGNENKVGTPGIEILMAAVEKPGVYNVKLEYRRTWEKMSLESFEFTVVAR